MTKSLLYIIKYKRKLPKGFRLRSGYIEIRLKYHPFLNSNGYYPYHRYVYEQFYKCILLPSTVLHHIDKNPLNNSIENLMPMSHKAHVLLHQGFDALKRFCSICKSKTSTIRKDNGRPLWRYNKNKKLLCHKCYMKKKRLQK